MADVRTWTCNHNNNSNNVAPTDNNIHEVFLKMAERISKLNNQLFTIYPCSTAIKNLTIEIDQWQRFNTEWNTLLKYTIAGYCKIGNLKKETTNNFKTNEKAVVILDEIYINKPIHTTLALGFNFVYDGKISFKQIEALKQSFDQMRDWYTGTRHEVNITLNAGLRQIVYDSPNRLLHTNENETRIKAFLRRCLYITRQFLKDNPHIIVANADKGKATIILLKDTYMKKIESYIKNEIEQNTYIQIAEENEKQKIIEIIDILTQTYIKIKVTYNKWVTEKNREKRNNIFYKMLPSIDKNTHFIPALYVQIKVHKPNLAVRPIVANPGDPLANLQITLLSFLEKYIKPQYKFIVTSSTKVVDNLDKLRNTRGGKNSFSKPQNSFNRFRGNVHKCTNQRYFSNHKRRL